MKTYTIQSIAGFLGGVFSFLFGPLDAFFMALICLEVIDFFGGVSVAVVERKVNSEKCFRGLLKKIFILAMVALGQLIDIAMGQSVCRNVIVFFYIANEAMSIIENAGKIGLPVPKKVISVLEQLKGEEDNAE